MRRFLLLVSVFILLSALLQGVNLSWGVQVTSVTLTPLEDSYIDSSNSLSNFGSSSSFFVELFQNATHSRVMQGWLKFSLMSIPPQATVQTASLSVRRYDSGLSMYLTGSRCTDNSWSESAITWSNAPLSSVPPNQTYTSRVLMLGGVVGAVWYQLNVAPDVQNALSSGYLTEVLRVYPPLITDDSAAFYTRESVSPPSLTITYSSPSAAISVSPASTTYGQAVTVTGDTDPRQVTGSLKLQYSVDNATWSDLASASGGALNFTWTPPSGGTFYLRSVWTATWAGGSYAATSGVSTLTVGKAPSLLSLSLSDVSLYPGRQVTLTATLSPPLSTGTVTLQYSTTGVDYTQLTAGTPTAGSFTHTWTPPGVGVYYLRATWSGDPSYNPSTSAAHTLTVRLTPTVMTFAAPTSVKVGEAVAFTATLRDVDRKPINGAPITFSMNATVLGTVVTGSSGIASLTYTITVQSGTYVASASYAGSATHESASESIVMLVRPLRLMLTSGVAQAPLFRLDGVSYTTDASGKVVVNVNSTGTYTLTVESPVVSSPGVRAVFHQWTDGVTSPTRTVVMDADQTYTAFMRTQFLLTAISAFAVPQGGGWYDVDANASFAVQPTVDEGNGTRDVFTGWSGDVETNETSGSVVMSAPKTVTASWKRQFYVSVNSDHGTAGGQGWYDEAVSAVVNVTPTTVDTGNGTRFIFTGWTGDLNATDPAISILVDAPKNTTASWRTQHFLEVKPDRGNPKGRGWHDEGVAVNVSVETPLPAEDWSSALGGEYVFDGWTGDVTSQQLMVTVVMDGPKRLEARWRLDYTRPLIILGVAALAIIIVVALAIRGWKPRHKQQT